MATRTMSSKPAPTHNDTYVELTQVLDKLERKFYQDIVAPGRLFSSFVTQDDEYHRYTTAPTGLIKGNPAFKSIQKKLREKKGEEKKIHQEFNVSYLTKDGSYGREKFGKKFLNKINQATGHLEQLIDIPYDTLLTSTKRVPLEHQADPLRELLTNYYVYPIFEIRRKPNATLLDLPTGDEIAMVSPPESGYEIFKNFSGKTIFNYGREERYVIFLEMCAKIRYVNQHIGTVEALKVFMNECYPKCIRKGTRNEIALTDSEYDQISTIMVKIRDQVEWELAPIQAKPHSLEVVRPKQSRPYVIEKKNVPNHEVYWV